MRRVQRARAYESRESLEYSRLMVYCRFDFGR